MSDRYTSVHPPPPSPRVLMFRCRRRRFFYLHMHLSPHNLKYKKKRKKKKKKKRHKRCFKWVAVKRTRMISCSIAFAVQYVLLRHVECSTRYFTACSVRANIISLRICFCFVVFWHLVVFLITCHECHAPALPPSSLSLSLSLSLLLLF